MAEVPESRMWEPTDWDHAHAAAPKSVPDEAPSTSGKAKAAKQEPPAAPPKGRPPPTVRGAPGSGDQPRPGKNSRTGNARFVR